HFLTPSARDQLIAPARRPDLAEIQLSCKNTNVPLPYVDLVNEILENAISQPNPEKFPQTTWTAEELAAGPEHSNPRAYEILAKARYPWNLFDLEAEEARVYLDHLGTSRAELIETFQGGFNANNPSDIAAEELLKITPFQRSLITAGLSREARVRVATTD